MADIVINPSVGKIDFFTTKGDQSAANSLRLTGTTVLFAGPISASSISTGGGGAFVTSVQPTTNYLSKFTGNSTIANSLVYDNGTNVGIGTTSPTANLTIYNSSTPTIDLNTGASTSRGRISATSSDLTIAALTSSPLVFKIDTSEKVRIASDGNVGIGTTTVNYRLEVLNSGNENVAKFRGSNDTTIIIGGSDSGGSGEQYITYQNVTTAASAWMVGMDDGEDFRFAYGLAGEIDDAKTKVKIGQDGNVGIGTTIPVVKLDVVGSAAISSTLTVTGTTALNGAVNLNTAGTTTVTLGAASSYGLLTASGTNAASIYLNGANRTGFEAKLQFGAAEHQWFNGSLSSQIMTLNTTGLGIGTTSPTTKLAVSDGTTIAQVNPSSGVAYFGTVNNYPMALSVNSSEKVRILNDGNVGIGTSTPAQKLHVVGAVYGTTSGQFGTAVANGANASFAVFGGNSTSVGVKLVLDSDVNRNDLVVTATSGNIGIGTSSAAYKLDVFSSIVSRSNISTPRFSSAGGYVYGLTNSPSWNQSCGTYTNNNATAPDGTTSAGTYTLNSTCASYDLYQTISSLTVGRVYTIGMWVKLGTATNFCLVVNNTISWNSIGGKAFTSSDGLSTGKWTHISYTFTAIAPGNINLHLGYHAETAVTQQTAGTVFLWNIEMTEFSSIWIGNVEDEIRLPGSSIWTSRGNVGIGTTNTDPLSLSRERNLAIVTTGTNAALTIVGGAAGRIDFGVGATRTAGIYSDSSNYTEIFTSTALPLVFSTNSAEKMRIKSDGNVGIGTTSPGTLLQVHGATPFVRINTTATADHGIKISYGNSDTHGLHLLYNANSAVSYIDNTYPVNAGFVYGDIYFRQNVAGTMTTRMTIKADGGNVGIGTTSPLTTLNLSGAGPTILTLGTTSYPSTYLTTLGVDTSARGFLILGNNGENQIRAGRTSTGGYIDFYTNNTVAQTTLASDGNFVMRLSASGNVGIGTDTPILKLVVKGASSYPATTGTTQTGVFRLTGGTGLYNVLDMGINESTDTAWIQATRANSLSTYDKLLINPYGGNVGIGTTSPAVNLHVVSSGTTIIKTKGGTDNNEGSAFYVEQAGSTNTLTAYGDTSSITGGTPDQTVSIWTAGSIPLLFQVGGGERVRILSDGNVGIGTTSPGAKLQINNASDSRLIIYETGTAPYTATLELSSQVLGTYGATVQYTSDTEKLTIQNYGRSFANSTGGGILFKTKLNNTTATDVMVINGFSGNVGIGSTAPAYKLDVSGTGRFTGTITGGNNIELIKADGPYVLVGEGTGVNQYGVMDWDATNNILRLATQPYAFGANGGQINLTTTGNVLIGVTGAYNSSRLLQVKDGLLIGNSFYTFASIDTNSTADLILSSNANPANLGSNSNIIFKLGTSAGGGPDEKMRIISNGNVGIGTTSPNKKLQIIGSLGKGLNLYEVSIDNLGAAGTQAKRFEIARVFIDYNDWNYTGPIEIEVRESFYSDGRYKRYVVSYGYASSNVGSLWLVEDTGRGSNDFKAEIGAAVQVTGDIYYVPIYIDVDYYLYVDVLVITNRTRTTNASSPSGGVIYINESPTGSNISSFGPDEVTYLSLASSKTYLGYSGNVGIGTSTTNEKLSIYPGTTGGISLQDSSGNTRSHFFIDNTNPIFSTGIRTANYYLDFDSSGGSQNAIRFYTGTSTIGTGTERMRITSGGNVGIGTTSPSARLHVFDSNESPATGNLLVTSTGGNASIRIDSNSINYYTYFTLSQGGVGKIEMGIVPTSSDFYINPTVQSGANGAAIYIKKADGNVGIGTTSPVEKFDVRGGAIANGNGTIKTVLSYTTEGLVGTLSNHALLLYTNNTEKVRIQSNGNVGIGTTSPSQALHILTSNSGNNGLTIATTSATGNPQIRFLNSAGAEKAAITYASSANAVYFYTDASASNLMNFVGANVGIGTTSPTQKLDVNGTVLATAFSGPLTGNVTGNATNVTGTVAIVNGGTGATSAAAARTNLGIANNYLYAKRTTNQTISTGTWANRDIIFNINSASSGIAYDTATGVASLTGGKVYRITALLSWSRTSAFSAIWSLFNNADNSQLGPDVYNDSVTYTINEFVNPTLDMILAPTSSIDVKIRTTSNMSVYDSSLYVQGTNVCLIIQQIA